MYNIIPCITWYSCLYRAGAKSTRGFQRRRAMRIYLTATLVFALLSGIALANDWDGFTPREPSLKQPGHWEWAWDGSDGLGIAVPATVHYQRGGPARIVITGPEDELQQVRVGQGQIRFCRDCWGGHSHLDITVSGVLL